MKSKPLIVANWKMNSTKKEAENFFFSIKSWSMEGVVICPPFTLLADAKRMLKDVNVKYGAQDVSANAVDFGSFTGDISAAMLKDLGCDYVIVGHSERRKFYNESNALVKNKIKNAHAKDIIAIVCVGEDLKAREAGKVFELIDKQLSESLPDSVTETNTVIAYEPLWAIGTGKSANNDEIVEIVNFIRKKIEKNLKIIYGGSVNKLNVLNIFSSSNLDGVLVGGASLVPEEFESILNIIRKI